MGKARRRHGDHIDIALDRDHRAQIMRRLAGIVLIVEHVALVKERSFRRVHVFRRNVLLHGPAAEGDDPAGAVADREHHPVAELVVGHGDVLPVDQKAALHHLFRKHALAGQMIAQRIALGRCIAQTELALDWRHQAAVGEIAARLRPAPRLKFGLEKLRRHLHHVEQARPLTLALLTLARPGRQGQARVRCQPLHRFGEGEPLGAHEKIENVAVLARGEVEPGHFLVIDEK